MNCKKVAVIGMQSTTGEKGGAERFYEGLVSALEQSGVEAEYVGVLGDESNFEGIEEAYLRCYDLDLSTYDGVISTKAPAYLIRHPNHICYLQRTVRAFYDMFDYEFPHPTSQLQRQRELIHRLDSSALRYPRTKKVFVIGNEVRQRLLRYNQIDSEVLYQSLNHDAFACNSFEYVFMPGRLHRWKRVDLIIKAMKYVDRPLELRIAGTGENDTLFRELAGGDVRIVFCGRVSDEELVDLYANALVIPFVPIREDFGLITLEAFRSCKPIVTCYDSGEPTYLVRDGETGFVCPPDAEVIASRFEYLYDHPEIAKQMGLRGRASIQHIRWETTANKLLSALEIESESFPNFQYMGVGATSSVQEKLFPQWDCYTLRDPSMYGFHDLVLPDGYRWIRSRASCRLPSPVVTPLSRWVLLVTANADRTGAHLSVEVNGAPVGDKFIATFGRYWFNIESHLLVSGSDVEVLLRVSHRTIGEEDQRLAMTIYGVRLIDVDSDDAQFDERALFLEQAKIFRPDECGLSKILLKKGLSRGSKILDVGAGVGWTSVLLANYTGAYVTAIDPSHYKDPQEHTAELKERFSRHLTALRREPGFGAITTCEDISRAVDRCSFLSISAMDMDFEDNTFDFVFSLNAFEHIPDPGVALQEIKRVLKPGGEALLIFSPLYYSDAGSHLPGCGLLDKPWAQLLYDREQIRRMVVEAGRVPNEIDNILDSLNGWSVRRYNDLFDDSGLRIVSKDMTRGFTVEGAERSEEFKILKERYSEEDLTTIGMRIHLRKERKLAPGRDVLSGLKERLLNQEPASAG